MKHHVSEQLTLFASIIKWTVYASVVGTLAGLGTAFFLKALSTGSYFYEGRLPFQLFLPASLLVSSALVRYLAPDAAGHMKQAGLRSFTTPPLRTYGQVKTDSNDCG